MSPHLVNGQAVAAEKLTAEIVEGGKVKTVKLLFGAYSSSVKIPVSRLLLLNALYIGTQRVGSLDYFPFGIIRTASREYILISRAQLLGKL